MKIREEYEETLRQIAEIEQRLLGGDPIHKLNLSAAVESVIPTNEPFTVTELMRSLEAKDPGRVWPKASVLRHVTKLRELKLVRRLKRHTSNQSAVYIRDDQSEPFTKTLRDVVGEVVTKPMRTAEVVHEVLATGWETTVKQAHFRTHVIKCLKQAGFREVGGKWGRVS